MDYLPIFIRIHARSVLVVGGGIIALRKVRMLLRANAHIRLVAHQVHEDIQELLADTDHEIRLRGFEPEDLDDIKLVVAATDDEDINHQVYNLANQRNLPINVVDNPSLCSFIFPSIVDRSPLVVAVSSSGASPVLARLLRARLETLIPSAYGSLAALSGKFRLQVKDRIRSLSQRLRFWESVLSGPVAELMMSGKAREAEALLIKTLYYQGGASVKGEVYLVGAGPGDPDLLTFRALRLMQQADVVLYDRLVSPEILNMTRQDAEKIHVGKERRKHTMAQERISEMLVRLAREGQRVLRLKGGDPFIFGRGGEELETLAAAGVPFQVVPGITAASGCAAYAGIPLTHRDYAQSVRFLTGHLKNDSCDLDWSAMQQSNETLVFYMGLVSLPIICAKLIAHGRDPDTPVALIQQGTTPHQKTFIATLATMPEVIENSQVMAPTLTIIGDVVRLHGKLAWKDELQIEHEAGSEIGEKLEQHNHS